jgi:hypothetical protein
MDKVIKLLKEIITFEENRRIDYKHVKFKYTVDYHRGYLAALKQVLKLLEDNNK